MSPAPVLFVRGGALGDFVLTLPVLDELLRAGVPVDVACAPRHRPLLDRRGLPPVRRVWDAGGGEALWMHGGRDPVGYGAAFVFGRAFAEGLAGSGIPEVRWVEARPPAGVPAGAHFARVLDGVPGVGAPGAPQVFGAPGDPEEGGFVVIAPGSGGAEKRVSLATWERVAGGLEAARPDLRVRWVAGPLEAGEPWATEVPDLAGLVDRATRAAAWLGPDSGPSHLAAAARRGAGRDPGDVYVWFGPTDPAVWAPEGASVVRGDLDPDALVARILARLAPDGAPPGPATLAQP